MKNIVIVALCAFAVTALGQSSPLMPPTNTVSTRALAVVVRPPPKPFNPNIWTSSGGVKPKPTDTIQAANVALNAYGWAASLTLTVKSMTNRWVLEESADLKTWTNCTGAFFATNAVDNYVIINNPPSPRSYRVRVLP